MGNGKTYRGFYNAPLDPAASYDLLLGVVSSYNNVTKIVYSNSSDLRNRNSITHIPYMDSETHENGSMVVIVLAIGIAFLTCVLIFGIVSFYILTQRVSNRRRRLTDNQELTLHGPMIEVVSLQLVSLYKAIYIFITGERGIHPRTRNCRC